MTGARDILAGSKDYWLLSSAKLFGLAVSIALAIASARLLGPEGRGEFATVASLVVVGVQLLNLGLSSSLLILFSEKPSRIRGNHWLVWALGAGWAALLAASGFALARSAAGQGVWSILRWWPFWSLWIPLQLIGLYQSSALNAMRAAKELAVLETSGKLTVGVFGLTALWLYHPAVAPFLIALILSDALIALGGARWVRAKAAGWVADGGKESSDLSELVSRALRIGLRAYPLLFLPHLVIKSDLLLLRFFRGAAETGVYSISSQIIDVGLILPITVASLEVGSIVRSTERVAIILKLFRSLWPVLAAGSLLVLVGARPLIHWVLGIGYLDSYAALVILLPGFLFLSLETIVTQYYSAQGYPLFLSLYWLLALLVNIGLNLIFIPVFGMYAAAATSTLAYGLVFALVCGKFLRSNHLKLAHLFAFSPARSGEKL